MASGATEEASMENLSQATDASLETYGKEIRRRLMIEVSWIAANC
ncbi:MAG: hypothetical protein RMK89_01430 [Armatimonadota bacterium]|nr:hypothetical protein [Armatimonadota bacterium]MDW8142100.1 hypothetical protein [Armatimonadota bacterium]